MKQTIEDAASEAAGNWEKFDSFCWHGQSTYDRPEDWTIVYTSNRDSGLLTQSNADAIEKLLEPFTTGDDPDIVPESHSHWACGHVDGYVIRVYQPDGEITAAFAAWFDICQKLDDYPVLDEDDWSEREYNATLENIADAGRYIADDYDLPEDWVYEVYQYFSDNNCIAIESRDDQGGYPSESELRDAFSELGYDIDQYCVYNADGDEVGEPFDDEAAARRWIRDSVWLGQLPGEIDSYTIEETSKAILAKM